MFSPDIRDQIMSDLDAMREGGTYKAERIITSPQGADITVSGSDPAGFAGSSDR